MRPSVQIAVAIVVLLVGGACFYFGISGILDGSVEFPSKTDSREVIRAASPKTFVACVVFWLVAGVGSLLLALKNFREATRRG